MTVLSKEQILKYLGILSDEIGKENLKGEILVFGGAAMVLAFNARPSTNYSGCRVMPAGTIALAFF